MTELIARKRLAEEMLEILRDLVRGMEGGRYPREEAHRLLIGAERYYDILMVRVVSQMQLVVRLFCEGVLLGYDDGEVYIEGL